MHTIPELNDSTLLLCHTSNSPNAHHPFNDDAKITFEIRDPATARLIGTLPDMTRTDTTIAISRASTAFPAFRSTTARHRATLLRNWHDLLLNKTEDLATLITWENGKPLPEARAEVAYAAGFLLWFSEEAARAYGDTIPSATPGRCIMTVREPVGVCALITPWNFPAAMVTRKVGAAVAAGCTVVLKPAGECPLTALAIVELGRRAGVPEGVVNVVTALRNTVEVGEVLTTDSRVKKVSFTGSTGVGKLLMRQASGTVKKCSFELGGNSAFVVFEDADVREAVEGLMACKFRGAGQTCVCANRAYVHETVMEEFASRLVVRVKEMKFGHGFDAGVTHGPLIHARAVQKVGEHVQDALQKGARLLIGGERMLHLGSNFFQPTILAKCTHDMRIAKEETFGPVAALFSFSTEDEVVKMVNDTAVGLAGYFYSRDIGRIYRVADAFEVGMVGVNTGVISDPAAPFGGVKESGFGREGSKYGLDDFTVVKTMTIGGLL